ncbi:midasin [Cytidiella melzeri]|nr:midasin [Cytidiella melzeri]
MASTQPAHDPLTINLAQQTRLLLDQLPRDSSALAALQNVPSRTHLLKQLARLLATPGLTTTVATLFRPLLLDLCARWLEEQGELEEKLEASTLLLEIHPEIFPVFSQLLSYPYFAHGPLGFLQDIQSIASVETVQLHRILLAYYRILHANRDLPRLLDWPTSLLSRIVWERHPDPGARFLAIRCYALQSGMMEGERVKMEKEALGEVQDTDCPVFWDTTMAGTRDAIDGWILPIKESERVVEARQALLLPQKYYEYQEGDSVEPIHPAELSPLIANVHGVLMLRSSTSDASSSPLVHTSTAAQALRDLAVHLCLNVPTLLTSSPSSGKSLLLAHLATIIHSDRSNQIVTIHLADTSLDPRSLLGSYVSSPTRPGTFVWKEGVLVKAMREGRWVVFEDVDRGSNEVLGLIKPLVESLGLEKWIGGRAEMEVPSQGLVRAAEGFSIFATRSIMPTRGDDKFPSPTFFGAHKFHEVIIQSPTSDDLRTIVDVRFPRLSGSVGRALIGLWDAVRQLGSTSSVRDIGMRELEKLCLRVDKLLPSSYQPMDVDYHESQPSTLPSLFANPTIREDIFFECRDVFFGAGATTAGARMHFSAISTTIAEQLGLSEERRDWVLDGRTPDYILDKDVNGAVTSVTLGRTRLVAAPTKPGVILPAARSFAMHKPAICLLSRIASSISLHEPILLTGETGTGKTSIVTHLASLLRQPLISLNLSNQTEASDIVGGFKPIDARVPATELYERFLELFGGTFSRKKNAHFEDLLRKAVQDGKWKRAVALWSECVRLAKGRIQAKLAEDAKHSAESETPRKRRKTENGGLNVSEQSWMEFERDVRTFDVQHVQGNGKFAFAFMEGPLVKALRLGHWILLDEVNLASAETLECVSSLLHGPTASITLTEQGSLEPIPRHPNFRLFACMNPATDVGKKDLPPNIRSRFTEIDVPPPDADRDTLLSIVAHYIGPYAVGDKGAVMDVAEFYTGVRTLAEKREIADGSNHRPHFSMRTLARALTFAADLSSTYSLRRALWEGCLMAFTMALDSASAPKVTALAQTHILANVRNIRSLLSKEPLPPQGRSVDDFIKFGPFYLGRGPIAEDPSDEYIITPSVETKLVNLARIAVTRKFPVLIEGPTSSGKTSSIEYLAKRTGHRFVRINNHEHTDIQEYIGTYVSDPTTGKLVFKDGLLVRALRNGDWIVLDELNLAPTDVLEALNRLLDDNRELVIPETQEVVKPHPHFMLFATQNPPGLYGGRKVLSRAFRNRFLDVHFEDVPQGELETILCQRCRIAPSYGQRIVAVFQELQRRRQSGRVFESKHGFATLRDLFRWAGRDALNYQELADNGYMLLAERARREEDKKVVKDVLESVMKVSIDPDKLYDLQNSATDVAAYLGVPMPETSPLVWTSAMKRLFVLVARALRFNEPILLVGETGCGKTSVCQVFAEIVGKKLHVVNCHQNTETADLIGNLRPLRNRATLEAEACSEAGKLLQSLSHPVQQYSNVSIITRAIDTLLLKASSNSPSYQALQTVSGKLHRLAALFEWHDGPLIHAMRAGDVFLMDEISLADDSVLERLNSVLEPGRTIVLAERGGAEELPAVHADEGFKLAATMNPGGDYGKKELSPALRNRFTEIWVPAVDTRSDLDLIVRRTWRYEALGEFTGTVLDFTEWLSTRIGDHSVITLRDVLAWVEFANVTYVPDRDDTEHTNAIFHDAAHMTFLDGLGSFPQLSAYSSAALAELKKDAIIQLNRLFPISRLSNDGADTEDQDRVQLGSFSMPRGPLPPSPSSFSLQAPTTRDNVNRVVRACQLPKPILLEGSPGVGKTSLVAALANICGHHLCRINLSDQTDLVDLFGSDLPVEGGAPGQFAWKDADFLRALQEGHWVLLDEMNLAPQAVLEGLNAVLDHRGTVYIPELGRSFTRHPSFRIFAAQNPLHQGGGRKGLPKSFLNRFTKVFVQELSSEDMLEICRALFPAIPSNTLRGMIDFTAQLNEESMVKRAFAREGAPWEFNLRDVLRWGSLIQQSPSPHDHPSVFLDILFLQRFRTPSDRQFARALFDSLFPNATNREVLNPPIVLSPVCLQVGRSLNIRKGYSLSRRPSRVLHAHHQALQALNTCVSNRWLAILTGQRNKGKNWIVRLTAHLTGNTLQEISINSATDASDLLGSFEEVDARASIAAILQSILGSLLRICATAEGSHLTSTQNATTTVFSLLTCVADSNIEDIMGKASQLKAALNLHMPTEDDDLEQALELLTSVSRGASRFEWVDGPLVRALKRGDWVVLDGANLCNPSVLDRLNALCETNGALTLNEKGAVNGSMETITPHPNFRLFMCVDSHYGELSRAMRNRGVEIALANPASSQDSYKLAEYLRLPIHRQSGLHDYAQYSTYLRRGLHIIDRRAIDVIAASSARLLCEDSTSSAIMDLASSLCKSESSVSTPDNADAFVVAYCISPSQIYLFRRLVISFFGAELRWANVLKALAGLANPHVLNTAQQIQGALGWDPELPAEHLFSQPLDVEVYPGKPSHEASTLRTLLRLVVASSTSSSIDIQLPSERHLSNPELRARESSVGLIQAIQSTTTSIYKHIDVMSTEAEGILAMCIRLLSYAAYLHKISTQDRLDHSAVYTASRWLEDCLQDARPEFTVIQLHARALSEAVTLTSGLGLVEIWSSLSVSSVQDELVSKISTLDAVASMLPRELIGLRGKIFDLMNLLALPRAMSFEEGQSVNALTNHLYSQLPELCSKGTQVVSHHLAQPVFLIVELNIVSRLHVLEEYQPELFCRGAGALISLAVQDPSCYLSRFCDYQQALWLDDARKMSPGIVYNMHKRWLEGIWETVSLHQLDGPSLLLAPTVLLTTISHCDHTDEGLLRLFNEEEALKRHLRIMAVRSATHDPRIVELRTVLLQMLALISACFSTSFEDSDFVRIRALSAAKGTTLQSDLATIVGILGRSGHPGVRSAAGRHLQLSHFAAEGEVSDERLYGDLGRWWIEFSRFLLDLFVPNIPIDPDALQRCSVEFWLEQRVLLEAQIAMLRVFVARTQGNARIGTIRYLEILEAAAAAGSSGTPTLALKARTDLGRLHTYWAEVQQFMSQVLSEAKLGIFSGGAQSYDPSLPMREPVLQASIAAFCQRLGTVYPNFRDINSPIQTALYAMKLGLRLVAASVISHAENTVPSISVSILETIVKFPAISGAEQLQSLASDEDAAATFATVLVRLTAISFQVALCGEIQRYGNEIGRLYEQAYGLWSIDRAREEEKERESQSLYRRQHGEDAPSDAEFEEQDFLSLFPEFGDLLDGDQIGARSSSLKTTDLVTIASLSSFMQAHERLFSPSLPSLASTAAIFENKRRALAQTFVQANYRRLSEKLDTLSLPFQMGFVSDELEGLHRTRSCQTRSYDFYYDENVPEIRKAVDAVGALTRRLDLLLAQWPDQMVLRHLHSRCETAMQLSFRSPIAKVLSALEQLVMNIEDWEMYANRENSLRVEQQALITLIISWRRLELSAWQGLLDRQARDFASATSEWWFRLYDATIRGVTHVADADLDDAQSTARLTSFLEDLVPLLDEYMNSSAIGHFSSRLSLLHSMEIYANYLSSHEIEAQAIRLRRLHCVLHATRQYYSQFSAKVSEALGNQRTALEKDILGFIKLASWKDVNVHALKQSAQKTHRHLYRIIRKFRDVLRQPVLPLLIWSSSYSLPKQLHAKPSILAPVTTVTLPTTSPSAERAAHLLNLSRTFQNFATLVRYRIAEKLSAHDPLSVESLAEDMLTTSQALAKEPIPPNLDAARRAKLAKNLLTRKRKAWSDFMKELKRAGISASVKAEVLQQHISKSWVREQPVFVASKTDFSAIVEAEDYLYRLFSEMPALRAALSNHHPDISTRDLQRASYHAESVMSMAIRNRMSLVNISNQFDAVERCIQRLQMIQASPGVVASGQYVEDLALFVKETTSRLSNALQELADLLRDVQLRVGSESFDAPSLMLEQLGEIVSSLEPCTKSVGTVWDNVHLSEHYLLLKDEEAVISAAMAQFEHASASLNSWLSDYPHLHIFIDPIISWLATKTPPAQPPKDGPASHTPSEERTINVLLLTVQNLLAVCPPDDTSAEAERDNYIKDDSTFVCQASDKLGLASVADSLQHLATDLSRMSDSDVQTCLGRVLPFLEQYSWLVHTHIENQANWGKALFKLNHVICAIVLSVAKDGFCQPKDAEEASGEAGGEKGQEMVGGSGMGEGTGQENVSKEIQDESQVEGLQGDDNEQQDEKVERAEEGNAIEMSEDFGGKMQDVPEGEEEEGDDDEEKESEGDPEERHEQLDPSDENAIDEKLWGDEQGPDTKDQSGKTDQDHSTKETGQSEVVAKEGEKNSNEKGKNGDPGQQDELEQQVEESMEEDVPEDVEGEEPNGLQGELMDEHMQDANTLDLPDELQLEETQDSREEDGSGDAEDDLMDEDEMNNQQVNEEKDAGDDDAMSSVDDTGPTQATNEDQGEVDEEMDDAVAEADTHAGDGAGTGDKSEPTNATQTSATELQEGGSGSSGQTGGQEGKTDKTEEPESAEMPEANQSPPPMDASANPTAHEMSSSGDATGTRRAGAQSAFQARSQDQMPNPLRSLGDALKDVAQRISEILDSRDDVPRAAPVQGADDRNATQQLEYVREDDTQTEMQALGPARQDEVAKLRDLNIIDDEEDESQEHQAGPLDDEMHTDVDPATDKHHRLSALQAEQQTSKNLSGIDSALTPADIQSRYPAPPSTLASQETQPTAPSAPDTNTIDLALLSYHSSPSSLSSALDLWRLYTNLTSPLSHTLCEQLRLILAPTLATRLRGDFRTGKRLNMKKIIPYVASEYTKDKIWLRRTRPSKREYQVLVALDDSKSMAEGKSVHLAFQTLAVVCTALGKLEAGEVAVARFGETVEVLHNGFSGVGGGGEQWTDQAGAKIVEAFRFDQKATQVLKLLEESLGLLEQARERRASASAGELWQLEIIISDGMCQDHERLRTVLRKAQEQRVMVVFVILDSLHSNISGAAKQEEENHNQNSILAMNQVAYKEVNGRMELTVSRYLDSFPFEYYVVVRDVEALPEVLAGTLKQFFERVSEE